MTPSEKLVGRRIPREASYRDQILAGYLREDMTPCLRSDPSESWLRKPFLDLRRKGLVKLKTQIGASRRGSSGLYGLTEEGEVEAREAKTRVQEACDAREAWSRDLIAAYRRAREALKANKGVSS